MKPYDAYEIHGVAEQRSGSKRSCEQVPDEEAQFWSLYGHISGEGVECIGDFKTRRYAEEVLERITGGPHAASLLAALEYLLEQTVDMDQRYGIELTEGESDTRDQALAAIASATS